jgi:hypothetical protein
MSLKGIISIAGVPGLFKVLAQSKSGFIVESLVDKRRMPVSSAQKISMLEDISVFTIADDMPLTEVMLKIKEHSANQPIVDPKSEPAQLREYFKKVIPEFDSERVYPSDIKKILNWFQIVKDIVDIKDPEEETANSEAEQPDAEAKVADSEEPVTAPKKKRAVKSQSTKDEGEAKKNPSKIFSYDYI